MNNKNKKEENKIIYIPIFSKHKLWEKAANIIYNFFISLKERYYNPKNIIDKKNVDHCTNISCFVTHPNNWDKITKEIEKLKKEHNCVFVADNYYYAEDYCYSYVSDRFWYKPGDVVDTQDVVYIYFKKIVAKALGIEDEEEEEEEDIY